MTAPPLLTDKIKQLLTSAIECLSCLKKENRRQEITEDDELENHYAQLASYLERSRDKTSGAARYIERKNHDTASHSE